MSSAARPDSSLTGPSTLAASPIDHDPTADQIGEPTGFLSTLLVGRIGAALLLPAAAMALPVFGPQRFRVGAAMAVTATLANLAMAVRARRGRPVRGWLAASDSITLILTIALLPQSYSVGVILLAATSALYLFWFGGRVALRLLAPTVAALLVVGLWHRPDLWFPMWLAYLATVVIAGVPIARMAGVSVAVRDRYDSMVNGIDAVVWETPGTSFDADYVSDRVADVLGLEPEDLRTFTTLLERVVPEDRRTVIDSRRHAADGDDSEAHYRIVDRSGRTRWVHERITVARDGGGTPRTRGVIIDETARWIAEKRVRAYADFVEGLPIALTILRLDDEDDPRSLRVVVGNPASAQLVGAGTDDVVGARLCDLVPLNEAFLASLADVATEAEILERPFIRIEHLGAVFALRAVPLPDRCIGIMLEDVTARANRSRSLQHQATHDHLTGLPNRAMFNDRLGRALDRITGAERQVAVLMVDLNQFKEVNDTLGHEVGDLLLVDLAQRLSRELRYCDTIARLGGDEFAVLLTDSVDADSALAAARRVQELCEQPFEVEGFRLQVGASIGIARAPDHATEARKLLRLADLAMYRAKAAGGGVVVHSLHGHSDDDTRIGMIEELRAAVASEQLVVHYQPRVDLETNRVVGVEALVRWTHPRRGLLAPADFIELAEVSGEIDALTRIVLAQATSDMAVLDPGGEMQLHVNLSGRSLRDPRLTEWVRSALDDGGFAPASLCLELNEGQLMEDWDRAARSLTELAGLGVRLSVDDFGTGGTSVTHLHELPIEELKIDPLVLTTVEHDSTLVRSIIELCHNLGIHVVAEGVESREALLLLRELGCDSAQGFHLAPPMPREALRRYLDRRSSATDPTRIDEAPTAV